MTQKETRPEILQPSAYSLRFMPQRLTRAIDWHGHLSFAAWLVELMEPKSIVELGVFRGDSLSTFSQAVKECKVNCEITGVDTWGGDDTTGRYNEEVYHDLKDFFATNFPSTTLFRGLFDDALSTFEDNSIEILHIDGCHHYEAVKHDFETWLPKLSKDKGVVLFHDISVAIEGFGAKQYWNEIKDSYPSFSFSHSNGLGVLLVGRNQVKALAELTQDAQALDYARAIFELSGSRFHHLAKEKWWRDEANKHAESLSYTTEQLGANLSNMVSEHVANYLNNMDLTASLPTVEAPKSIIKRIADKF
ncbi:class I SAM-dependent methyltransferase [Vibrio sonorensis]|uniref:class I SAM-dependent methyltransferase n=1 Tax=Vibrio sonorensis TaxID=1004316 RepID=UPI0008D9BA17|nr:class I SAM-dependent methyltransferase [Vibrio sonorensis]